MNVGRDTEPQASRCVIFSTLALLKTHERRFPAHREPPPGACASFNYHFFHILTSPTPARPSARIHLRAPLREQAGLARDIAKKVDAAFFADTTTNGPSGLGSLTTSTVDTGGTITNTRTGQVLRFVPVPQFALDVQQAGGWLEYMRDHTQAEVEAEKLDSPSTQAGHGHAGTPRGDEQAKENPHA